MIVWKVAIRESSESALIGVGLSVFKDRFILELE